MRRWMPASALAVAAVALTTSVVAQREGVTMRHPSLVCNLISAEKIENTAEQQCGVLKIRAAERYDLGADNDPQMQRIQWLTKNLLPHTVTWNVRAKGWQWHVILVNSGRQNRSLHRYHRADATIR
jgi:hypothetical protein